MVIESLIRALHFIAVMALYGCVLAGHLKTARELPRAMARRIAVLDRIAWVAVLLVLAAGLILWFGIGRGPEFYLGNGLFHVKVTLFVALLGLMVWPTLVWSKLRGGDADEVVQVPKAIKAVQGMQLLILLIMPVLAALVGRGVGLSAAG